MKKILFLIAILIISINIYAFDNLWQKAQQYAENGWKMVPGYIHQVNVMKNEKTDEVMSQMDVKISTKLNDFEIIENELIEAFINDEPADENTQEIKSLLEADNTPSRKGMFLTEDTENIKVKDLNSLSEINGIKVSSYQVKFTTLDENNKKQILEGTVWLDSQTGRPVLSEMTMKKTPMFVKSIDVKTYYGFNDEGQYFYPDKVEMDIHISALGQKMHNKTNISMKDYWKYN
ncbi:MAG: hypothetical protein PHY08_12480 [Candidatus Cloacimonetes bacterium]|nr:hypothetical protein [Candidatus Cloacimonadota bacterium]MDD4157378.1 hypothetical protein [Candidatus Cloacimonadota bacterium]